MSPQLDGAVELLERALAYTRIALLTVDESPTGNLGATTPCTRWDLAALLAHMDDALDAFTEAAAGLVDVRRIPLARDSHINRVEVLQLKACALLGAWLDAPPDRVLVGDAGLAAPVLVATSALEITTHGWDVARATGTVHRIPPDLAGRLLAVAEAVLEPADRAGRFAEPVPPPPAGDAEDRLIGHLGRTPVARYDESVTPS